MFKVPVPQKDGVFLITLGPAKSLTHEVREEPTKTRLR